MLKRILCFFTGGCKFKYGCESTIDENNMVTITETCYKCGKKYSFTAPLSKFGGN